MLWHEAFKDLDLHWGTDDEGKHWHVFGMHSCNDYHPLCGVVSPDTASVERLSPGDEPSESLACPHCLFRVGQMVSPYVVDEKDRASLHTVMISLQEQIRLLDKLPDLLN